MPIWIVFALLFTVMLVVDLGMIRKSHAVSFKKALGWSWPGLVLPTRL